MEAAIAAVMCMALLRGSLEAQTPQDMVREAVQAELAAARNDHSHWRYRQEEKVPVATVSMVVETAQGTLKEKVEQDGRPLTPDQAAAEAKRVRSFLQDAGQQQRQRRDGQHDDESAEKLLRLLPVAFTWKLLRETPQTVTLGFAPDTAFEPSGMEARVMSAMAGELVVDRAQHRIRTMRGALAHEVDIGFGLLGKLRQGGTFDVERREVGPGVWEITETHVHIDGRALLFKTIGQQQDEVNTGYARVPEGTTLEQAAALLSTPSVAADARGNRYAHR